MTGTGTSPIADHISVAGLLLGVSNVATSPDTLYAIANIADASFPLAATEVLVTNVSDTWVRRVPTLLDMGKVTTRIFWVMEESTHRNSAGSAGTATGLRYLFANKLLRDWQLIYPDGNNSTDAFSAYVTSFTITAKVGGVFEAAVALGTTGVPQLV